MVTLWHRPYVFGFLVAFIGIACRHLGWRRTLGWLATGFGIALASEACSIRIGFPYGTYHYIYENLRGEWVLFGVPVWDSLSYPFLIYAGYAMARQNVASSAAVAFLGALFTLILDVIIDPLTVRGDRWFLGRVYYYPHGGLYFGVPLSNFAGWYFVPFVVIALNQCLWRLFPSPRGARARVRGSTTLGACFYCSIACFNIAITFWIGEWRLGLVSLGWLVIPCGMWLWRLTSTGTLFRQT